MKFKFIVTCFILTLVMFSCASRGLRIKQDYDMAKNPGKSILIGKISAKLKGGWGWSTSNSFHIIDKSTEEKVISHQHFSRNEHFFITLDHGEYIIETVVLGYGLSGALGLAAHGVTVNKPFTIGENEVVYIGKLVVEYRAHDDYSTLDEYIMVYDEYELAVDELHEKYPNIKKDVRKSLLK